MSTRTRTWALAGLVALILHGCGDDIQGPDVNRVQAISISPPEAWISVGQTVQLVAAVVDHHGALASGHSVTWTSLQPSVATVTSSGLVRGVGGGTATIRAQVGNKSSTVQVVVFPPECIRSSATFNISMGQSGTGHLDAGDCHFWGAPSQGWRLNVSEGTRLHIEVSGSHFGPQVTVTDQNLNWVADGSPFVTGTSAHLAWEAPAGSYIVWVRGGWNGEVGAYTLSVEAVEGASCSDMVGGLSPGETATGALHGGSCLLPYGTLADPWSLRIDEQTRLLLALESSDFDPFLLVTDTHGDWIAHSWWDSGGSAAVLVELEPGDYIVWASADHWRTFPGTYRLSAEATEGASCVDPVGSVAPSQTVTGELTVTSCVMEGGWFADPWELVLDGPGRIQIDLSSSDFDAFLFLTDMDGNWIAWDDDGGPGLNSRLIVDLGEGNYLIWATTYGPGETGSYRVAVRRLAGETMALPDGGWAGPESATIPVRGTPKP